MIAGDTLPTLRIVPRSDARTDHTDKRQIDTRFDATDHGFMPQEGVIKPEDILALVRQEPFKPFRIHMSDGASYDIPHPELAMVFPRRVVVVIPSAHREGLMQDLHYCAILHITRLEELVG